MLLGYIACLKKFYRKVEQGTALIINTRKAKPNVTFTGGMVLPIIHKEELMKIGDMDKVVSNMLNTIDRNLLIFSKEMKEKGL